MPETGRKPDGSASAKGKLRQLRRRVQVWSGRRLPPGVRLIAGLLLILGGILGFLPVLGFWMIPLGVAVASLDLVPLWRWLRR
jgi:hypothetical protein